MKLTFGAFKQLRFTGVLLLLAIIAAAGWLYWNEVDRRAQYLTSRDFRLLTVLASQTQAIIDGDARVIAGILQDDTRKSDREKGWSEAATAVPFLRDVRRPDLVGTVAKDAVARFAIEGGAKLRVEFTADGPVPGEKRSLTFVLGVGTMLGPTFESKLLNGVFDTLVLATPDGSVVFATGRRKQEVSLTPLDSLLAPKELPAGRTFRQEARTISVHDAIIAGVNYKLYIQPCCDMVATTATGATVSEPFRSGGLIIAGLAPSDSTEAAALAISPGLLVLAVLLTLLALVTWPFLKLTFLGERQRVTIWDLVQLGACSVFGLALGAIFIVTADARSRLQGDIDRQLEGLGDDIRTHLDREMELAYHQLAAMENRLIRCAGTVADPLIASGVVAEAGDCPSSGPQLGRRERASDIGYPNYVTFALIDKEGNQVVKTTPAGWVPSAISVATRPYFATIRDGLHWHDIPFCGGPPPPNIVRASSSGSAPRVGECFMESLWSWTTGDSQAVLSKPTGNAERPVAALSVHLRSLLNPALPPGFEYALVSGDGQVLFHSDSHRNTQENLFIETDNDRRLRALIAGHGAGAFDTVYWGRTYRAFVKPSGLPGWSIVTLSDAAGIQGLLVEWVTVSLLLVSVYLAAWIAVILVALRMGSAWLWPDVRRRAGYRLLAAIYAAMLAVFGLVAFLGEPHPMLIVAVSIAAGAWLAAFFVLRNRPLGGDKRAERSRHTDHEYAIAGALFLVLCGIVPGTAFVVLSYDLHIESYVKHRQLGLARAIAERERTRAAEQGTPDARTAQIATDDPGTGSLCGPGEKLPLPLSRLDRYCTFFYGTTVEFDSPEPAGAPPANVAEVEHHDFLLSMLEEYLPYYAEFSVEMRELLHDAAEDKSWTSARGRDSLELHVARNGAENGIVIRSDLPSPMPMALKTQAAAEEGHAPLLLMPWFAPFLLLALCWLAFRIVRFLMRHVYLSSVFEPLWASGRLVANAGDNLLMLCTDASAIAGQIQDASRLELGALARADDTGAAWTRTQMRIGGGEPGRALVITDLDADLEDVDFTHRKLEVLDELMKDPARTLVVLSQTGPASLAGSVRPGNHAEDRALWARLLNGFIVVDWRDSPEVASGSIGVTVKPAPRTVWQRWFHPDPDDGAKLLHGILDCEGESDRFVRRICEDIRQSDAYASGELTREQLLDELEERTANYYQQLWNNCSDDERVVLGHVAQDGLVNAASRRIVRRLLVRRLLVKDPDLRLMNSTFRTFVLSSPRARQVAQLEGLAEPSAWDRLRLPFALAAITAGAFLFSTQRDMFNQTVAAMAGVAAAVPTIMRVVTVVAGRSLKDSGPELKV